MNPVLVVHGGAWNIPYDLTEKHRKGCKEAVLVGWEILINGGTALDAVEAAVKSMEDNPVFDAGKGSVLNMEGEIEMDALIMDGKTLSFGAVAAVKNIKHPVSLARLVMERSKHNFIVGEGALKFARKNGVEECKTGDLIVERERKRLFEIRKEGNRIESLFQSRKDTVGAIALDSSRNIAVATSTGGIPNKFPSRVGDTPLIGCGAYADNEIGAAAATGHGEDLMKVTLAKTAIYFLKKTKNPQKAAEKVINYLERRVNGHGGIIVLDMKGRIGVAYNTPRMAYGYKTVKEEKFFV